MSGVEAVQPPLFTLARAGDPQTSHDAAASLGDVRESQRRAHGLLSLVGPCTDVRLAEAARGIGWDISLSGLRTRRHELVAAGYVVDTGKRDRLPSGRLAIVWAAVDPADVVTP